jgi:hypothetical protein
MLSVTFIVVCGLLGVLIVGYLLIVFSEKNSEEPPVVRKWSDPSHRDE